MVDDVVVEKVHLRYLISWWVYCCFKHFCLAFSNAISAGAVVDNSVARSLDDSWAFCVYADEKQRWSECREFSAHVCCCIQTAGWIKMPLGTEVGLGPGDIVLDENPATVQNTLIGDSCIVRHLWTLCKAAPYEFLIELELELEEKKICHRCIAQFRISSSGCCSVVKFNEWSEYLAKRPHRRRTRTVQSYSPACANGHPI